MKLRIFCLLLSLLFLVGCGPASTTPEATPRASETSGVTIIPTRAIETAPSSVTKKTISAADAETQRPTSNQTTKATTSSTTQKIKTQPQTKEVTVYITKTGEKYHRSGCRYLSKSKIPIDLSDAKAQGYEPCSVCNPPR